MHVLMIASENDALPGGKVGGLGDVIRDLPIALARAGHRVTVVTPAYGVFAQLPGAIEAAKLEVNFCSKKETLSVHRLQVAGHSSHIQTLVLDHPLFASAGAGRIYIDDDAGPFATDAHKFALFCLGAAELLAEKVIEDVDVAHCHDWHSALFLVLRKFSPRYKSLQSLRTVFSIHNLSLQGVRPFEGVSSSLDNWLQGLDYSAAQLQDPNHKDCINLMRTGINLADRVHTVSPSYAKEIQRPSGWQQAIIGGEGLEADLQAAASTGKLFGILNGCDYSSPVPAPLSPVELWRLIESTLDGWAERRGHDSFYFALKRLQAFRRKRKAMQPLLVSVGRLTAQKVGLLTQVRDNRSVMAALLQRLKPAPFILLGSGEAELESFFTLLMRETDNFLFLRGYSDRLANALYSSGDLFVMPSVYEPCGISQLLAMRAGTPCLVHGVGGLRDTVEDGVNGFSFSGENMAEKLENLLAVAEAALTTYRGRPQVWRTLEAAAAETRFEWEGAVEDYLENLYL